ncbi:hypothetical protein PDJAM_G00107790 [Pangasius djambal]|uniref:Uncharacterized protein n=1 Tax=Pangasius djambal TaxID=1691987 RepID=A0ACC5Y1N4_9TELE|nr:hypothetical protein [Pangasius djambal]
MALKFICESRQVTEYFCPFKQCSQTAFYCSALQGYNNSKGVVLEASFTPDSQFVMMGSEDGKIHVWNAESGMKVAVLDGKHTGPVTCLQFNPKFMTFASACSNMAFWLPTIDD